MIKMENTNCGDNCSFFKSGFCNSDRECPFYCESIWQKKGGDEIQTVRDCYPKRATFETNNLHYKMCGLQENQEELRNRLEKIETMLNLLVQQSHAFLVESKTIRDSQNSNMQIEKKNNL